MKMFSIVLVAVFATVLAKPQLDRNRQSGQVIPILKYTNTVGNQQGNYEYAFETGNSINVQQSGYLKNAGNPDSEIQVAQGSYSYVSPEGIPIRITYVADENGFRAEGDAIPTPPPIPKEIQEALARIAQQQNRPQNQGSQRPFF